MSTWDTASNTAWVTATIPTTDDVNRWENNIQYLYEHAGGIATP